MCWNISRTTTRLSAIRRHHSNREAGLSCGCPAFQALYSEFDRKIGHFRRYRLSNLRAQLASTGFTVAQITTPMP